MTWWLHDSRTESIKRRRKARRKAGMKQNGQGRRAKVTANNPALKK